jgi:hypothetical protein
VPAPATERPAARFSEYTPENLEIQPQTPPLRHAAMKSALRLFTVPASSKLLTTRNAALPTQLPRSQLLLENRQIPLQSLLISLDILSFHG